ncbi:MAG: hypothetical protein LZF62_10055 [Nitrospira sp.]|nr:MAG: hypothetical protein LZF62_10055 [Nitrospira sp.]
MMPITAGFSKNIFLTRLVDLSTMAAFSSYKFEFISTALQGKVSREKGGVCRTSSC